MKYMMILAVLFVSCVMAVGEVSKDRLKELERLVQIDGVRDSTDKTNAGKVEVVQIDFSSRDRHLDGVVFRIAVELTDSDKNTYLVEQSREYGTFPEGYLNYGDFKLRIPHGSFGRLKITGYAVEHGVMDGDKFIPFEDGDYDDVKTYEELTSRTTTPFPEKCKLGCTYRTKN